MQFIAENPVEVRIRSKVEAIHDVQGRVIEPAKRAVVAKFHRGLAPQWARNIALKHFTFPGRPSDVEAETWVCFLDTDHEAETRGWTGEEHEAAVAKLLEIAPSYGYIPVEQPRPAAPWPTYDKLVAQGQRTIDKVAAKISGTVVELGLDPAGVVDYERENLNRRDVIAALEALVETPEPEAEEELVDA